MAIQQFIKITVGGVEHTIPRMRFKQLKIAMPYVARINKIGQEQFPPGKDLTGEPIFMELHVQRLSLQIEVLSAAGQQIDKTFTVEYIENNLTLEESREVGGWFNDLLAASGFEMGNVQTPEIPGETTESQSTGMTSSQNSPATESVEETGSA
jgi:hypothetical protein